MDGPTTAEAPRASHPRRAYQTVTDDITPKKSMLVVVIVVGCFAVLWPKVFYPMLVGNANQAIKPNARDKAEGCCYVFSETDVNTIELMSELCSSIIDQSKGPLSGKEIVNRCRKEVLETCGIDISAVLQEQIRFGRTIKQILNEVRSLNGSLCLKYHFGVSPWRLGVGHKVNANYTDNIKQERPPNMRPEIIHPAFRERGSAIPKPQGSAQTQRKHIRTVEGRPGPIPGMRPTMGGPGHVVPPSQKGGSTMGVLMPIYTIGIVIFFTYTLMKLIFKRENTGVRGNLYPPVDPDPRFRREVFENERCKFKPRLSRDPTGRIVVNAMSALLDEVNEEIEARRKANEVKNQAKTDRNVANGNLMNGTVHKDQEQASVKVLGMETTASCEGGEKWTKPGEPVMSHPVPKIEVAPPQEIYLQGALPAQSQILVTDYATVTQSTTSDTTSDPAVVLAGKMTLSVISMDNVQDQDIETNNGELPESTGEEAVEDAEESKYTTASSATVAEHEVSDEQGTDDEDANDEVERIHELDLDVNHISTLEEPEDIGRNDENRIDDVIENNFVVVNENNVNKDEIDVEVEEEEELEDEKEIEEEVEEEIEEEEILEEEVGDEEIEEEEIEEEEIEEEDGREKFEEEKLEKDKHEKEIVGVEDEIGGSEVVEDFSLKKNIESENTDKNNSGQQKEQSS